MNIETRYIPITGAGTENALKISVYYDLGGYSYLTGEDNRRGYYVSVCPVERRDNNGYATITQALFKGYKYLLKEVTRQSKKAEARAIELAKDIDWLIDRVCKEYGFVILKEE